MPHRVAQIESVLHRSISQVLAQGLSDPRVSGMVSVTRVEVNPDLREARVFVSVLPAEKQKLALHGLQHAAGHIQSLIARQVSLRTVPRLLFRLDPTLKKQAQVLDAIRRGREKDEDMPTHPAGEGGEDEISTSGGGSVDEDSTSGGGGASGGGGEHREDNRT